MELIDECREDEERRSVMYGDLNDSNYDENTSAYSTYVHPQSEKTKYQLAKADQATTMLNEAN